MSVYFAIRSDRTGLIKIGTSTAPSVRIRQLESDMKTKLAIVAEAPGTFAEERAIHRKLASHRVNGEWFEPHEAVLAVIGHVIVHKTLPAAGEEDREETIRRRFLQGDTLAQIGRDVGLTRERVRQIAMTMGLPKRKAA